MTSAEPLKVKDVQFRHEDIFRVVDQFYKVVSQDALLKIPFRSVADWPEHIERLTHFWWVRFGGKPYQFNQYNPVAKHFASGFNEKLLGHWLSLFNQTLAKNLSPEQAQIWGEITKSMGKSLLARNEMLRALYGKN